VHSSGWYALFIGETTIFNLLSFPIKKITTYFTESRDLVILACMAGLIAVLIVNIRRADMAESALADEKESHLASLKEDHKRKWEVVDFYGERMIEERRKTSEMVGRLEKAVASGMSPKEIFKFVTAE
jgi:hypothetical protein